MNLAKLYEAQAKLDTDIVEKKGLQGQNLLPNKILALNVELGELAQEVQGEWKYWKEHTTRDDKKVLDELVDCLHFALSIAIEGLCRIDENDIIRFRDEGIVDAFNYIFDKSGDFNYSPSRGNYRRVVSVIIYLGHQLGFTDDQIEAAYFKKNQVNHERQEVDY